MNYGIKEINKIKKSNLFNEEYYLKKYGNQLDDTKNLLEHYLNKGYKEGKNPSPNFETTYYLNRYPDVNKSDMNPLIHYLSYGKKEHRFINLKMELDYLEIGIKSILQQNLFDEKYYFDNYGKIINGMDCLTHYISFGYKESKNPSANFDNDFYLSKYPDTQNQNPLIHYALYGRKKGYLNKENQFNPKNNLDKSIKAIKENDLFDSEYYLKKNPDINKSGICPVTHYLKYGFNENREMSSKYNFKKYIEKNNLENDCNPLVHFALNYDSLEDLRELEYPEIDYSIYNLKNNDNKNYFIEKSEFTYAFFGSTKARIKKQYNFVSRDSNSIKLSKNFSTLYLTEINSINNNLTHCNENIQEKFYIDECEISRTIFSDGNKQILEYWFSKNNKNYNYKLVRDISQNSIDIDELHAEICKIIDLTSPIFDTVKEHLVHNYLQSIRNEDFNKKIPNFLEKLKNKISIIIPIYNAYEDTKACIESVFKHTVLDFNLILIDDVSTDSRISSLLSKYEKYKNVFIIKNKTNKGFTKNVNMGMTLSNTDVILLNSDTIVTKNWDQKLVLAAYSNKNIATVTPMTNASDISVPVMGKDNKLPKFLDINKMGKFIENLSFKGNILSPTGNGFCLFIKRKALNDLGLFDEDAFDKGYGEETDFTLRAKKNGWINVRNDSIFIFHNRSSSFSSDTANKLRNKHREILDKRYPDLSEDWDKFVKSIDLNSSNYLINFALNNYDPEFIKTNILYITDIEDELPNIDNIDSIKSKFNVFILTLETKFLKLWYFDSNFKLIDCISFDKELPNRGELNTFYMNLFHNLKIDLVFLRFSSSFQIPYTPEIIPIMFANNINVPILYGRDSDDLLKQLGNNNTLSNKIDFDNEKGVVYTALFGGYEKLLDPKIVHPNLDYICFTDDSTLKSEVWDIRIIKDLDVDNTRKARTIKILPHKYLKEYDFSIWIDAGFQIIGNLEDYVNRYSKEGLLLGIKHSWRNSIYEEFDAVLHYKKEKKSIIDSVKERYLTEGFPKEVGLIESGLLFRRHNNPTIINLMEQWYYEVMNYSKRDQLSFNYLCWKNNFTYDQVPIFYWKNQYVEHFFHSQEVINNKISLPQFKIILIANNDYETTKETLDSIKNINNNISIIILSLTEYSYLEDYNIKNYKLEYPEDFINLINHISNNTSEDFIYLMCSGDSINYSDIKKITTLSKKQKYETIGALILNEVSYIEKNISSNFNNFITNSNIIKNNKGVLINRKLLISYGGFKIESSFISNIILKLSADNYEIINIDEV